MKLKQEPIGIGQNLRKLRQDAGYSQSQVAALLCERGVYMTTDIYKKIEQNKYNIRISELNALKELYQVGYNCFKRIPENLEAVYLVFRMFLENICLNVKKMPLSPRIYGLSGNSLSNLIFHHFPVILSALKRFCISVFLTRLVRGILCGCFCDSGEGLGSAGCNLWIGETDCRIIELFERPLFGKCGAYGLPAG